ncbi:unnamed protein product, partial [Iphiclides podalirius]
MLGTQQRWRAIDHPGRECHLNPSAGAHLAHKAVGGNLAQKEERPPKPNSWKYIVIQSAATSPHVPANRNNSQRRKAMSD